jgi:outer membrane autotransporter protein
MRASAVRGLTSAQLRDRFALPFLPTNITNVLVPSGTCLLSGIAGPITGSFPANPPAIPSAGPWGNGGAQQTYLIGHNTSDSCRYDFLVLGVNYINQRALGANALWYAPVVGPGNAGNVGAYLDHLPAPPEYSDLYNVYNTLDVLNDGTATRLAPALTELTGENHASMLWLALGNADRAVRALSDHARGAAGSAPQDAPASAMMSYAAAGPQAIDRDSNANGRWWAAGGGVFGRAGGNDERSGYHYGGGQGVVGYDWRVPDWLAGAATAFETSNLTVDGPANSNTLTSLRAGGYGATQFAGVTFDAAALLSWDHYVTSRDLPSFARGAAATYDGGSAAVAVNAARAFPVENLRVEPLAGLSFVGLSRPGFTESGAGALSLVADRQTATKLASRLGATLSAPVPLGDMVLRPWLRAFWAHDFLDTEGTLTAAFAGATAPGTFSVLSAAPGRDTALVGAGVRLDISPLSSMLIAYDGDWGRGGSTHSIAAAATLRW